MKRRRKSEEDKVLAERAYLLRAWKKFHAEQLRETLVGLHHDVMTRLIAQLKNLRSARELVAAIEAENYSAVDAHTRLVALHEINTAITRLRERLGQPPIDDALPSEPARAFQLIKNIITRVPRPAEEPPPGYGTAPGKQ
jgi:predicted ABC-class ATPase